MSRLNWKQDVSGEWHVHVPPASAVFTVWVRCPAELPEPPVVNGQYSSVVPKGKWEIMMGDCYWSRDRGKYFEGVEEAKEAGEKLLGKIGEWIRGEAGFE